MNEACTVGGHSGRSLAVLRGKKNKVDERGNHGSAWRCRDAVPADLAHRGPLTVGRWDEGRESRGHHTLVRWMGGLFPARPLSDLTLTAWARRQRALWLPAAESYRANCALVCPGAAPHPVLTATRLWLGIRSLRRRGKEEAEGDRGRVRSAAYVRAASEEFAVPCAGSRCRSPCAVLPVSLTGREMVRIILTGSWDLPSDPPWARTFRVCKGKPIKDRRGRSQLTKGGKPISRTACQSGRAASCCACGVGRGRKECRPQQQ